MEQFVGQHLLNPFEPPRLTYWLLNAIDAAIEIQDYFRPQIGWKL